MFDRAEAADGRTRRRVDAMRRVQAAALDLFEARGYPDVSIEEIAERAGIGPASVYRNFGSKDRIVRWDDYDPMLFDAIAARLPHATAAEAVRDGVIDALDRVYAGDRVRILRRARLITHEPELAAATAADLATMRVALAALLVRHGAARAGLQADVLAAALVGTLDAAIAHWVRLAGRTALRVVMRRAFELLGTLERP